MAQHTGIEFGQEKYTLYLVYHLHDPRDNNNIEVFFTLASSFHEVGNPGLFLLPITPLHTYSISGCSQKGQVQFCSKFYGARFLEVIL